MKRSLLSLFALVLVFFISAPSLYSQMADPEEYFGQFRYITPEEPEYYPTRTALTENEMHVLDTLTNEERQIIEESDEPPIVGVIRDFPLSVRFSLEEIAIPVQGEITVSGGRLSRISEDLLVFTTYFRSKKADEIRIFFAEGNFPYGTEVNIFSQDEYAFHQRELFGQLDEYGFYTTTTFADYLYLQVVINLGLIEDNVRFTISKIIHVDNRYIPEDISRACYLDANCSDANSFAHIDGFRRATARLYFPTLNKYGLCSGTQLNDIRAIDLQPFLLTANHCFDTQTSAAGLEARFYYWSTSCNSGVVNPNHIIVNGSNLIATNNQTDFTLVLLKEKGGNYYMGWDIGSVSNNTVMHSVHHPGGTLMKYHRMQNKTSPSWTCTGFSTSNFHYTKVTHGQESGGSSGGGVVDPDGRIRGQLYGTCHLDPWDNCDYNTYYNMWGKFGVSYSNNNLQYWLWNGGASVAMSTSPSSSYNFGTVNIGSYLNYNITVTNTGTRPNYMNLEAGTATISGTNASQFSIIGATSLYLAPGESGTFTVRFTPTSSGKKTASLNIPHNADNISSPRVITLTGYGNPCSDIISLGDGGSANAKTFSKSGEGAWVTDVCGFDCNGNEQVYSFVAPYTGIYSIEVTATNSTFVDYFWKTSSCSSSGWNCIGWVYSPTTKGSMSWTAGTTYYILLDAEGTSLSTHTFYVFLNPCSNVVSLAGGGSANTKTFSKSGNGAWTSDFCGYNCYGMEGVYSFVAPRTGIYSIEVTEGGAGYIDYFWKANSCGSTAWECIDDVYYSGTYGNMNWTAGTTYYLLLDDENTILSPQSFYVFLNPCLNITSIGGVGSGYPQTYLGGGNGAWFTSTVTPCNYPCPGTEEIYSFVPPYTGNYKIQVTTGGSWVDYMWKSGSCSSADWECIDDIYSPGSHGNLPMTAGTTYYFLLDDEDTSPSNHAFYVDYLETPGTWKGLVSTDWNVQGNWSANIIPDAAIDVVIPSGTPHQPNVQSANGNCKSITVNSGASLTIGGFELTVENNLDIHGALNMNNGSGVLRVKGNVAWHNGSTAGFTANAVFWVHGNWNFNEGANANLANGFVDFTGSSSSWIRQYSTNSSFYHIGNYKSGTNWLRISELSTQPLTINGSIYNQPSCNFGISTSQDVILKGSLLNNGNYDFTGVSNTGWFIFDGVSQQINHYGAGTGLFNNVRFSSSTGTTAQSSITVAKNLTIDQGYFNPGANTVSIGGDWSNTVGDAGFTEGTSRVIFNGSGHQYIYSSETFNILEANMGAALRINNAAYTVTCNQYDWTSGGIDIIAGAFTALDLAQNGLYGGFWVNPGGTINLTNSGSGTWVDLVGQIYNYGGTMNFSGSSAWWPYSNSANLTMSGGVIDIKTCGLYMPSGYNSATYNITGGTIRTPYGFTGSDPNFTPSAGTFEFYGSNDYFITQSNGSTLHDVEINKTAKDGGYNSTGGPVHDERSGELLSDGGKSNTTTLGSDFTITGNLTIEAGTFSLGSYTCEVTGTTDIYGTLAMIDAANDLTSGTINWQSGSEDNVTAGTFHAYDWRFNEGTNAKLGIGNTAYIYNVFYPTDDDAEFGNLVGVPYSKILSDNSGKAFYPIRVKGDLTIETGATWWFTNSSTDLIVDGNSIIETGAGLNFQYADFINTGTLDLEGSLLITFGSIATVSGEITFPSTGWLYLSNGTFTCNYDVITYTTNLSGKLTMNEGSVLEFPYRGITIESTFVNEISGGTLRFGRTLYAVYPGTFELNNGTVEFVTGNTGHYIQVINGNYLYNMVVDKPSGSILVYDDLTIKGNLDINNGVLNSNNKTIQIAGDWLNNVGPAAFAETNSRVIFNGATPQFCSTEDFYTLEVNKPVELLYNVSGHNITCQSYDWTSGGVWISPGNFTAYDLVDSGLFGTFAIYSGVMNLYQDAGQYVDINGTVITGSGAELNIFGGNSASYWSWVGDATVFMTGGVLDFKDVGILVYNSPTYSFTENITAGIIRTTGNMSVHNLNFTPSGGTVELYGGTDAGINMSAGNFHNVLINKAGGDGLKMEPVIERDGKVTEGTRANTVNITSDILINNNLTVDAGTLNVIEVDVSAGGNVNVNSGGSFVLNNNSHLLMGSGKTLSVNNGGTLSVIGSLGAEAGISRISSGYYSFDVQSGGSMDAQYGIFEYMGTNGVNITNGALVDPANAFNYCTFRNGAAGQTLLSVQNDQELSCNGAIFPANTWGGASNVTKWVNQGRITFYDYSGGFAGSSYEVDPFSRVDWFEPQLSASPLTLNVTPPAGSTTFDITSNVDWTISESISWASVTPMAGSNNATITVNYTQNSSPTPRSGIITLSAPDVPNVVVTINQAGATLAVAPPSQSVGASLGSTSFNVTSNTTWTVSETVLWFSVLPMSGTGNNALVVSYNQNTSVNPRSGQITVSSPGLPSVVVTVNQAGAGATLTVTPANRDVAATAGSTTFSLNSNTGWAVSESVPWLSVTPMSGTGNGTLTVNYGENATGSTRVGTINVTATGGSPSVNVTVTQVSYPTHSVSLNAGWQGLSSYIMPANYAIEDVFDPLLPDFIIAQTMTGVYYPAGPINTIYDWLSQSAYKVKMGAPAVLSIIGNEETNKVFGLNTGWNLVPVIVNTPVNVVTMFSGTSLTIAKDVAGVGVYWPAMSINTLGDLLPGLSYYAMLGSPGSITFPANSKDAWTGYYPKVNHPDHPWNKVGITPSSHLIAIEAEGMKHIQPGDVLGVFSAQGVCFGVTEIADISQNALITAYADDPLTGNKDGFDESELMSYRLFRPQTGEVFDVEVEYNPQLPQTGHFTGEGLSAIKMMNLSSTGTTEGLTTGISIYPNPTDGTIWITGISGFAEIEVIGSLGTTMKTITNDGQNSLSIDLYDFQPGV
ncbi:MAG: choice-of-anchor D domain-containing protein, partial [Bacteroidales bacterium]|nr:choice-of-anchor D domain-containing protein [Bacteroidales bacterium]